MSTTDTLPQEEYSRGHIATSVSYPSLDLNCSEEEFAIREYFRLENPSPVVVYGSEQPDCQLHAARRLNMLQKDRKTVAKFDSHSAEEA